MPFAPRLILALALLLAAPPALAQSKKKPNAGAVSKPAAAPPAPAKAEPTPESPPARIEAAPEPPTAIAPPGPVAKSDSKVPVFDEKRLGLIIDLFGEGSRLGAEQWINNTRRDESFNYGFGVLSATGYMLLQQTERLRVGPAVRFFGNYGAVGGNNFQFGLLTEALFLAEYALPAFEKVDAIFGGRGGLAVLFPGGDFGQEISRLQGEGAGVWSLPRVGWTLGANAGMRRPIAGNFSLRSDLNFGLSHLWLFSTEEVVDGLQFRKHWGTDMIRVGLTVGAEVAF